MHELAHAAAALRLTRGPVRVHVGQYPGLVRLRFGRLDVHFHVLPTRGVSWNGICVFEETVWPLQRAWIGAVGPLVSLFWALGCAVILRVWGPGFDFFTRLIVAGACLSAAMAAVYNGVAALSPAIARERPETDGAHVLRALKAHRALRDHERAIGRRLTRAEMLDARRHARTSVAPPGGS